MDYWTDHFGQSLIKEIEIVPIPLNALHDCKNCKTPYDKIAARTINNLLM